MSPNASCRGSTIHGIPRVVAVLAFKAVVTLELKRKDNDKKVVVLQLRMREMMSTLVEYAALIASSSACLMLI